MARARTAKRRSGGAGRSRASAAGGGYARYALPVAAGAALLYFLWPKSAEAAVPVPEYPGHPRERITAGAAGTINAGPNSKAAVLGLFKAGDILTTPNIDDWHEEPGNVQPGGLTTQWIPVTSPMRGWVIQQKFVKREVIAQLAGPAGAGVGRVGQGGGTSPDEFASSEEQAAWRAYEVARAQGQPVKIQRNLYMRAVALRARAPRSNRPGLRGAPGFSPAAPRAAPVGPGSLRHAR